MTQSKNRDILCTYYIYIIYTDPKEFDLSKCANISSKGCVLEVYLEYQKELSELHNDYSLAPDKK